VLADNVGCWYLLSLNPLLTLLTRTSYYSITMTPALKWIAEAHGYIPLEWWIKIHITQNKVDMLCLVEAEQKEVPPFNTFVV
jgi:hypothetical protein